MTIINEKLLISKLKNDLIIRLNSKKIQKSNLFAKLIN